MCLNVNKAENTVIVCLLGVVDSRAVAALQAPVGLRRGLLRLEWTVDLNVLRTSYPDVLLGRIIAGHIQKLEVVT